VADYISLFHDQTNANIASGAGDIVLNPATGIVEGTSALTLQAGGANQDLSLKSSGTGTVNILPGTDSTTAIQLQQADGTLIFNVDSTNKRIGILEATPDSPLHITNTISTNTAIAGLKSELTFNDTGTAGQFLFGNRTEITVSNTTNAVQGVGEIIKVTDSTGIANTIRGLEIQAYNGTNNFGTNTGLTAFGKTFGVQGITTNRAGGVSEPAGVYAELQDPAGVGTSGNAFRAYSSQITDSALVKFYQEASAFTGQGLLMNFGNNSGSFTGEFIVLQEDNAGTPENRFIIGNKGEVTIYNENADNATSLKIDTKETTGSQSVFVIDTDVATAGVKAHIEADGTMFITTNNTSSYALCHASQTTAVNDEIVDCTGTPQADYAELYPVASDVEYGDVLTTSDINVITKDGDTIVQLTKSSTPYDRHVIGVAVDNYSDFSLVGHNLYEEDNPLPVALVGRVPVKVSLENGPILVGDALTTSSTPGVAMKATESGMIIGRALSAYAGEGEAGVMMFVGVGYFVPADEVNNMREILADSDESAFLINQNGSGSLLQLQNNGMDYFMVHNDGTVAINTSVIDLEEKLVVVKNGDSEVFSINARGDALFAGLLILPDDTFAGSIVADVNGEAQIVFSHHLGTGKPVVQLTPESLEAVHTQILNFQTDNDSNYTGFKLQVRDRFGEIYPGAIVHYLVIGKQAGYETSGLDGASAIVVAPARPIVQISQPTTGGSVAGDSDSNEEGDANSTETENADQADTEEDGAEAEVPESSDNEATQSTNESEENVDQVDDQAEAGDNNEQQAVAEDNGEVVETIVPGEQTVTDTSDEETIEENIQQVASESQSESGTVSETTPPAEPVEDSAPAEQTE
jgi:hypothetical protein